MFLTSPILGAIADRYGSVMLMNILAGSGITGLILLVVAISVGIDVLLFPAFIGLALMAVSSSVMTVLTGIEFEGRTKTR